MIDQDFERGWIWGPPNLSPKSVWFQTRITNLDLTIIRLPKGEPDSTRKDGIRCIHVQASSFGPEAVQELSLMWWEWEEKYWNKLCHGVSINFLTTPIPEIILNGDMMKETKHIAIKFMDKLVALNIFPAPPLLI